MLLGYCRATKRPRHARVVATEPSQAFAASTPDKFPNLWSEVQVLSGTPKQNQLLMNS